MKKDVRPPGPDVKLDKCFGCGKQNRVFEIPLDRWICPLCFAALVKLAIARSQGD